LRDVRMSCIAIGRQSHVTWSEFKGKPKREYCLGGFQVLRQEKLQIRKKGLRRWTRAIAVAQSYTRSSASYMCRYRFM
jgi:hypothetical protein